MKITIKMTIRELLDKFENDYKLRVNILNVDMSKNEQASILDIANPKKSINSSFTISENSRIEDIENMFYTTFGINIDIKDLEDNAIDLKSTISKILKSHRDYNLVDEDIQNSDTKKIEVVEEVKKETKKNLYTVSDRITLINEKYISYQKTENYKSMKQLLSSIEEALVSEPDSFEIKEHVKDIKEKSYEVSNLSHRKKRFMIIVFSILVSIVFIVGASIFFSELIYNRKLYSQISQTRGELNSIRFEKAKLVGSGDMTKANSLDLNIQTKIEEIKFLKENLKQVSPNIILIVSIVGILISCILIVKLNKYNITSNRFMNQ